MASRRVATVITLSSLWLFVQSMRLSDGMQGQLGRWEVLRGVSGMFWLALPLLVAVAVALDPATDRDGFLRLVRSRGVSLKAWMVSTAGISAAGGMVVAVLPLAVAALVLSFAAPSVGTAAQGELPPTFGGAAVLPWLFMASAMGGAAMALVALTTAVLSGNRYLTVTLPIVLFTVANIGPPPEFDAIRPLTNLALPTEAHVSGLWVVGFWLAIALIAVAALTSWTLRNSA
jgi:hypothetical protein